MIYTFILAWFPMLVIAIINGAIRDFAYKNRLGDLRAHQLSTLTGAILMGLYIWGLLRIWPLTSDAQAFIVGLIWLGMTVIFEFSMILFIQKKPLGSAFADYNLLAGRLWPLFLLWILFAPYIFIHLNL
jgi:hypothetical protein